jgi:CBS domain-containing protein
MPSQQPPTKVHPVAHINSFGDTPAVMTRGFVSCPRSGGSVPEERCRTCREAVSFTFGEDGQMNSVTCKQHPGGSGGKDEERHDGLLLRRKTVGDLMSRSVVCVRPKNSLDAAVRLFVETGLKAAPVVNEQGVVLGMVDESDVQLTIHATLAGQPGVDLTGMQSISDVMTPMSFAISEHVPATQAAGLMVYESVHRVPVVSADGQVIGILSASDLLYWMARSDGYVVPSPRRVTP